ncbi:tyrosine-type recombinase/integrase [Burkholderia arboris]|uniref:tyrosine-type recombinase/integrase n=1 Tax=Burkholderia arboris TaxID=488730 RepID=UPI00210B29A1|nr:integrase family protein [Burkholderia arboris]UTV55196.1 integrase family protein [Burkholderia arboris]
MKKVNFTAERVNTFQCQEGKQQTIHWDGKTPGLGLRVTAAGSRAYVFESRLFGKTIRITVGDPRAWTLAKARTEAARLKTVIDDGHDPREQAAQKQAAHEARTAEAKRKDLTFGDAWEAYLGELKAKASPKTKRERSAQYIEAHDKMTAAGGETKKRGSGLTARGPLYSLMSVRLSDLRGAKIAAWLENEVSERPTRAAYAYRMLKAFVRWCDGQERFSGLIPADCYSSQKVKALLPGTNTKEGDSLQREQLAAWFGAVRRLHNPVLATYLQGLLITGPRREELAELRWEDVDFQWNSLRLSDKMEAAGRTIPLPPYYRSLLLELKRINDTPPNVAEMTALRARGESWEPSPWVFPSSASASGHIEEPRYAHKQAIEEAGLPHVTLHGLRRSFGTLAEWCEVPVGIVAQIQGHKPSALAEKHYRRRPLDMLRMWHNRIEAWMLEQAGIQFSPEQTTGLKVITAA